MQLWIIRHGEASFDAPSDKERRLTSKGQFDTQTLGALIAKKAERGECLMPSAAFSSPYIRTRQTLENVQQGILEALDPGATMQTTLVDALTPNNQALSTINVLYQYLESQQSLATSALIVTHMPLISDLLATLIDGSAQNAYRYRMSPASAALIQLDVMASGMAELKALYHAPYTSN